VIVFLVIPIALACKNAIHLFTFYPKAITYLVQILKNLIPEQKVQGRNQHRYVGKGQMIHSLLSFKRGQRYYIFFIFVSATIDPII